MSLKVDGFSFAIGVLFCLCLDVVGALWQKQTESRWVTSGGHAISAYCDTKAGEEEFFCKCDLKSVATDEVVGIRFAVKDSILAAFGQEEKLKHACDEACVRKCFAKAETEGM